MSIISGKGKAQWSKLKGKSISLMCGSNCSLPPPPPIHTPSIAILACDSLGPDTEKVGDLNKRGKRFSCDVDGVRDQGGLARGIRKYFLEEKGPKFAIFRLGHTFMIFLRFYLATIVRRRRKFSFLTSNISRGVSERM